MGYFTVILISLYIFIPHPVNAMWDSSPHLQSTDVLNVNIASPVAGQAVQGSVIIRGNTDTDGFQSYEVDFSYIDDPTQTWFLIQESTLPIQDGILAVWDTSTITDGDYNLRLVITRTEGVEVEIIVTDLRVRNYTPIETETHTPTQSPDTLAPGVPALTSTSQARSTPLATSLPPTPSPLPTNPAEISTSQVMLTFGKGAACTIGIFAILGTYVGIRLALHNHK